MITELQVRGILETEFPEMNFRLSKLPDPNNIYNTMSCFVDFTKQNIRKGRMSSVKHCFRLAERLLDSGNNTVKNAIENVFVYSIGIVVDLSASTPDKLKNIFNGSLKKEYQRQISTSGV